MRITYDDEASAGYIYFTEIGAGSVAKTIPSQPMDADLDEANQIIVLKLAESEDCLFPGRLDYTRQHPNVTYDEVDRRLIISFADDPKSKKSISWDANIDLDEGGQILGLEILFADPEYIPDDEQERLFAEGKLKYIAKYIVPFD